MSVRIREERRRDGTLVSTQRALGRDEMTVTDEKDR